MKKAKRKYVKTQIQRHTKCYNGKSEERLKIERTQMKKMNSAFCFLYSVFCLKYFPVKLHYITGQNAEIKANF